MDARPRRSAPPTQLDALSEANQNVQRANEAAFGNDQYPVDEQHIRLEEVVRNGVFDIFIGQRWRVGRCQRGRGVSR